MSETKPMNAQEWLLAKYPDASPYTLGEWNDIDEMEAYASYVSAEKDERIKELEKTLERERCHHKLGITDFMHERQRAEAAEAKNKELEAALREFKQTRGRHDGEHDSSLTVCSRCNESYVLAEAKLDGVVND